MIFLFGPPGVGKSTLGRHACAELGVEFLDFGGSSAPGTGAFDSGSDVERLARVVCDRAADVIELPWELQQDQQTLVLSRKSGTPLLLWAHPEDMQARSGRAERLFTPVPRLKIRGGFGRNGTGCREFRRLDRACGETLLLVDLPLGEATEAVKHWIEDIRKGSHASPADREGIAGWVEDFRQDHAAGGRAALVMVEGMARYLAHLRAAGRSPRALSAVRSDLNAAGHLVLMYDAPTVNRVLCHFDEPPWVFEFKRKFSESPTLVSRYRESLQGFAQFLREHEQG